MKNKLVFLVLFVCFINLYGGIKETLNIDYGNNSSVGKYLKVKDSKIYYETYGNKNNTPLVLIHGNGGSIKTMVHQIDHFSHHYYVIVADNRTHGKSGPSEHLTYEQMASDYNSLLESLKLKSVYIIGQSDGGIIGLIIAMKYPDKVSKLISISPNLWPGKSAIYSWELKLSKKYKKKIKEMIKKGDKSRNWQLEKQHMELMEKEPHIKLKDLKKIKCEVMLVTGDDDIIRPEHILKIYKSIAKAQLFMMPGATHFMIRDEYELFNLMADRFLSMYFKRPKSKDVLLEIINKSK